MSNELVFFCMEQIDKRVTEIQGHMGMGSFRDIVAYREKVGKIEGLKEAKEMLREELRKDYEDEESGDGTNAKAGQAPQKAKRSHKR